VSTGYAAFFCPALTLAHRALCAAAIFLRADAGMVRLGLVALLRATGPTVVQQADSRSTSFAEVRPAKSRWTKADRKNS
jgi:hypothetical protein